MKTLNEFLTEGKLGPYYPVVLSKKIKGAYEPDSNYSGDSFTVDDTEAHKIKVKKGKLVTYFNLQDKWVPKTVNFYMHSSWKGMAVKVSDLGKEYAK